MASFEIRALEYNANANIWSARRIERALEYMRRMDLNTLVLNDVYLTNRVVYPASLFAGGTNATNIHQRYAEVYEEVYRLAPRGRSRRFVEIEYLRWVIGAAHSRDIKVYLNNKEITFPDSVIELRDDVLNGSVVCPTHPYWVEFIESKYDEMFTDLGDLDGMITSPGTGESRVTIAGNRCTCERCQDASRSDWYQSIILAMHRPAVRHGVDLVVRDFVFDKATQEDLAKAWAQLPDDIAVCLKNTPHDYYPTFPHNPRIADATTRPKWVEFDSMAQYFGWGVAPAITLDDLRSRLDHARSAGVTGILSRTDWEILEDHSCFDTPNILNLDAFARLAVEPATTDAQLFGAWLERQDAIAPGTGDEQREAIVDWVASVFTPSWSIIAGLLYADECVFNDSSSYPASVKQAFWLAEYKNSLRDWEPDKWDALVPTADNVRRLLDEKDAALARMDQVVAAAKSGNPGLTADFYDQLVAYLDVAAVYLRGFWHAARVALLTRHVAEVDTPQPALAVLADQAIGDLTEFSTQVDELAPSTTYPAFMLLSGDRLRALADDARQQVGIGL